MGEEKSVKTQLFDNLIGSTGRPLVSKAELAELCGVSVSTIQRDMRRGLCDAAGAVVGGSWRFNVALAWEWWRTRGK